MMVAMFGTLLKIGIGLLQERLWDIDVISNRILVYSTLLCMLSLFFFQAEDGIRDVAVTGVQTCALPISSVSGHLFRGQLPGIDHVRMTALAKQAGPHLLLGARARPRHHEGLLSKLQHLTQQIGRASCRGRV